MNREQDFCTPADILAEHSRGTDSADCPYANLRQAVAYLIRREMSWRTGPYHAGIAGSMLKNRFVSPLLSPGEQQRGLCLQSM